MTKRIVVFSLLQMACGTVDGSSCVSGPWAWSEIRGVTAWFVNCVPMIDEGRSGSHSAVAAEHFTSPFSET